MSGRVVVGTEAMTKKSHEAFENLFLLLKVHANRYLGVAVGHFKEQTEEWNPVIQLDKVANIPVEVFRPAIALA